MSDVIDTTDFDHLPDGAGFRLFVPMICPHCSDIHGIPCDANSVPPEGLGRLVEIIQKHLIAQGYRIPTQEELAAANAQIVAQAKEREEFAERVKALGGSPFYIHRTSREGGDA